MSGSSGKEQGWGAAPGAPCPAGLGTLLSAVSPGMTMEMVGTLMGATVHGLIVSGAHGPHTCEDVALPSQAAISPKAVSAACSQSCFLPNPQHLLFRVFLELLAKNLTPTPKSWPILHQTCLLEARQKATDRPVV